MQFVTENVLTLSANAEATFAISWNLNGIKTDPDGIGDKGPIIWTPYPFHAIGETAANHNVFDGHVEVIRQGVIFHSPSSKNVQWYQYKVTVRNRGPKKVSFKLAGATI